MADNEVGSDQTEVSIEPQEPSAPPPSQCNSVQQRLCEQQPVQDQCLQPEKEGQQQTTQAAVEEPKDECTETAHTVPASAEQSREAQASAALMPAHVLDCYGKSEVVGRTRSGRVVRTPARYVPTMDSTERGQLDLTELDQEELAAVEEGDTDDITSVGEEEEESEKELDAELAVAEPTEADKKFLAPPRKRKRAEDAWEEPVDENYSPTPEELKAMEEEDEMDRTETDDEDTIADPADGSEDKEEVEEEEEEEEGEEQDDEEEDVEEEAEEKPKAKTRLKVKSKTVKSKTRRRSKPKSNPRSNAKSKPTVKSTTKPKAGRKAKAAAAANTGE
jgi:hypothetical protein